MKSSQPRILRLIIVLVSLGLSVSAVRTIVDLTRRRDIVSQRETELATKIAQNRELEAKMQEVKSVGYVEKVARNTLGLVRDGESIVMMPSKPEEKQEAQKEVPNWQKWWELFF